MKFILEFDEKDMIILNDALVKLPYMDVAYLIDKINVQLKKVKESEYQE